MQNKHDSEEYIEPSIKARLIVVLIVIVGVMAIALIKTKIDKILSAEIDQSILIFSTLLDYLLVFSFILSFCLSTYFVYLSQQIRKTGRYPPPGFSVIRKTHVFTGHKAKKMIWLAYLVTILAWFPVVTVLYIKWLLSGFT